VEAGWPNLSDARLIDFEVGDRPCRQKVPVTWLGVEEKERHVPGSALVWREHLKAKVEQTSGLVIRRCRPLKQSPKGALYFARFGFIRCQKKRIIRVILGDGNLYIRELLCCLIMESDVSRCGKRHQERVVLASKGTDDGTFSHSHL
jgi:hypothetical protein